MKVRLGIFGSDLVACPLALLDVGEAVAVAVRGSSVRGEAGSMVTAPTVGTPLPQAVSASTARKLERMDPPSSA